MPPPLPPPGGNRSGSIVPLMIAAASMPGAIVQLPSAVPRGIEPPTGIAPWGRIKAFACASVSMAHTSGSDGLACLAIFVVFVEVSIHTSLLRAQFGAEVDGSVGWTKDALATMMPLKMKNSRRPHV